MKRRLSVRSTAAAHVPWALWTIALTLGFGRLAVSNVASAANGPPWVGGTRAARYDILAVTFAWPALGLLYVLLRHRRWPIALALGVGCGLAGLAQFMGAFVLPVVGVSWLWARGRR